MRNIKRASDKFNNFKVFNRGFIGSVGQMANGKWSAWTGTTAVIVCHPPTGFNTMRDAIRGMELDWKCYRDRIGPVSIH